MKTKDVILIAVAVVAILLFTVFMFMSNNKSQLDKIVLDDMQNDSVIIQQQQQLQQTDSTILLDLKRQGLRLYKLEYMHINRDSNSTTYK